MPPALFGLAVFKTARPSITLGLPTWASAVCASLMITGDPAHIPVMGVSKDGHLEPLTPEPRCWTLTGRIPRRRIP